MEDKSVGAEGNLRGTAKDFSQLISRRNMILYEQG
jgi:hypothetical protein